jgi:hypothetical protein
MSTEIVIMEKKKEKTEQNKKKKIIPVCEENPYIKDKQVREGTGVSKDAKILMG